MSKIPLKCPMTVQQYQKAQHNTVITKLYLTEICCVQLNTAHNIHITTS